MAQSLIEQLQADSLESSIPISTLMRKAKLASTKLKADDFSAWINSEMSGYVGGPVPDYRMIPVNLKFFNYAHGQWFPILGLNSDKGHRKAVGQSIGQLEALLADTSATGYLTMSIPDSLRDRLWRNMEFKFDIQYHLANASIVGVIDAVRNNVLEWALKLEAAGVHGHGLSFTAAETTAAQTVTNNFHAPVASISQGYSSVGSVTQTNSSATPAELADAIALLITALSNINNLQPDTQQAASDLAANQTELREGRVKAGAITRAIETLSKAEDVALRAPEVAGRIHDLLQMIGLGS